MKKIGISFLIVIILCLIAYAIYYYFNNSTKPTTTKLLTNSAQLFQEVSATEASKNIQQTNEIKVTLAYPKQAITIVDTPLIKLAGATKRNTLLSVTGGKETILRKVDSDGSFAPDVPLNEGVNSLSIMLFDANGGNTTLNRIVLYLKDSVPDAHLTYQGTFISAESDKLSLKVAEQITAFQLSKQSKLYQFNDKGKTLLRNSNGLTEQADTFVISDNEVDQNALIVIQDLSTPLRGKLSYDKVQDKSVEEEIFSLRTKSLIEKDLEKQYAINSSTLIYKADDIETKLRGSDIKIGDTIMVYETLSQKDEVYSVSQILIVPGQAAGVLKDVKDN